MQKKIALKNQRVYDDSKQSSGNEQEGISYEPRTGFTPIGLAGTSPLILVVKSTLPSKPFPILSWQAELWQRGGWHWSAHCGRVDEKVAGINMIHVPYRGSAPIITDLVSVDIQVGSVPCRRSSLRWPSVRCA